MDIVTPVLQGRGTAAVGRAKAARLDSAPLDTAGPSLRLEALSSRGFKDSRLRRVPSYVPVAHSLLLGFSAPESAPVLWSVCIHTPGSHSGSGL